MTINKEQQEAIEHTGTPLVIYAGPGTGKTFVLLKKYEHLIEQGIQPIHILGITFTRNAAKELSQRITEQTQLPKGSIQISTFHRFCLGIIKNNLYWTKIAPGFQIASPEDQDNILKTALRRHKLPFTNKTLIEIKRVISCQKKEQETITEDYIHQYTQKIEDEYEKEMKNSQKIDFDDIIKITTTLLQIPQVLQQYREHIKYILLDEAQDTTKPQAEILYLLNCKNTTIAGDPNQSIYSFAGSNPNFMQEFGRKRGAKQIHLIENYRNPQPIINSAEKIIQHNTNYVSNNLKANNPLKEKINVLQSKDEWTEARLIANAIAEHSLKQVTILYRRNESANTLELALQEAGVPYERNGINFQDKPEIKNIIDILNFLHEPSTELFASITRKYGGLGDRTITKIIEKHKETEKPLIECATMKYENTRDEQHHQLNYIYGTLKAVKDMALHKQLKAICGITPNPLNKTQIKNIEDFKKLLQQEKDIDAAVKRIKQNQKSPNVRLMTLHSSKGTESNTIFIIGTEEGLIPDAHSLNRPETIEEERRLFYVGLTRTRKNLILSYTRERSIEGLRLTQHPSRYIKEIPEKKYL